jgi:hypothetical protein
MADPALPATDGMEGLEEYEQDDQEEEQAAGETEAQQQRGASNRKRAHPNSLENLKPRECNCKKADGTVCRALIPNK